MLQVTLLRRQTWMTDRHGRDKTERDTDETKLTPSPSWRELAGSGTNGPRFIVNICTRQNKKGQLRHGIHVLLVYPSLQSTLTCQLSCLDVSVDNNTSVAVSRYPETETL